MFRSAPWKPSHQERDSSFHCLAEKDLHHFMVPSYLQRKQYSGWEQAGDHTKPVVLGFGLRLEPMQKLKENTELGSDADSEMLEIPG